MNAPPSSLPAQLEQLHQTYCRLTGQNLSWRFDRERLWFEFLRAGFTLADLTQVVRLSAKGNPPHPPQRRRPQIIQSPPTGPFRRRPQHQPRSPHRPNSNAPKPPPLWLPTCSPAEQERGRQRALEQLRDLKEKLRQGCSQIAASASR